MSTRENIRLIARAPFQDAKNNVSKLIKTKIVSFFL